MKTTPYELVFGQPPRQLVLPGAKCGSNIMEEDLEDIINDHLPFKSDDQPSSKSDDQPPSESDDQPPFESDDQPPSESDDQPPSESDDQPPSESDDQPPSESDDQPPSKSHARIPSGDQPPSESDDQPPSVSDTQHLSKSSAQDVSESDDQLEKKSNNSPQRIVKANSLLATSDKHKRIREQADASYRRNAERMQVKYTKGKNKKVYYLGYVGVCMYTRYLCI